MTATQFRSRAFDVDAFLRDHWQRRPLLIRNPWAGWVNPLDPNELAGLACEDGVEARLVLGADAARKVEHGPFKTARLRKLSRQPWTLLVQAVDHFVPDVAALIDPFRFVPNWRIDDVMVSCANDGGGVGPHFDQYDVFLIQGLGRRRWQLGGRCDVRTPLAPHDDLRLLAQFVPEEEWLLEPGDILYVPPNIAHDGVAVGDSCMTYSVGFRAPSRGELLSAWCDDNLRDADDERFRDAALDPDANPGEISAAALARLHAMLTDQLLDRDAFAHWFGRTNSASKYPEIDWTPEQLMSKAQLHRRLAEGARLERNPASRFSFVREGTESVILFVDGKAFPCHGRAIDFAERVCAERQFAVSPDQRSAEVVSLIATLFNQGSLAFSEE